MRNGKHSAQDLLSPSFPPPFPSSLPSTLAPSLGIDLSPSLPAHLLIRSEALAAAVDEVNGTVAGWEELRMRGPFGASEGGAVRVAELVT